MNQLLSHIRQPLAALFVIDAELRYRFITTGKLGKPRAKTPLVEGAFDWADFAEDNAVATRMPSGTARQRTCSKMAPISE
jgi:hypothetical protein